MKYTECGAFEVDARIVSFLQSFACNIEKRVMIVFTVLGAFSAVGLVAMMMITVVDATARRFFSFTIYGAYEGVSFLLSGVFFFSLCYCTSRKGHFAIDVLTLRFRSRVRARIVTIMRFISSLMCWLLASQLVVLGIKLKASNLTGSQLTFVPIYVLVLIGAFCLFMTGWSFFVQFVGQLARELWGESPKKRLVEDEFQK